MSFLHLALTLLFGNPRAAYLARVAAAVAAMCPCAPADAVCEGHHARASYAIAIVATEQPDTDEAAALLLGTMAHETGGRTDVEMGGGPAVSVWQLEVRRSERAALLADPVAAARQALRAARACKSSLMSYAGGDWTCHGDAATCARVDTAAAELRHYVARARSVLAAH